MLYLSIAICSNALMFLLLKHYDRHGHSKRAVLLVNYITASLIGVFLCWKNGIFDQMDSLSLAGSLQALLGNFRGKLSAQGSMLWALILGTIAGGFCFAALALIQIRIGKEDAGIVSMFTKLGILVPVILSIFIWAELPSPLQWIGIALAVISIVVANLEPTDVKKINIRALLLLFFVGGIADFLGKVFQKYALMEYRSLYLFLLYSVAALLCFFWYLRDSGAAIDMLTVSSGVILGASNICANGLVIRALIFMPACAVYPAYSAGVILVVVLSGAIVFRERLEKNGFIAIVTTIASLIFLNL